MDLRDRASRSFVLIRAGWTAEAARRALAQAIVSHVIVQRTTAQGDAWYLFPVGTARAVLAGRVATDTVEARFGLAQAPSLPVVDVQAPTPQPPAPSIVTDGGRLLGFLDQPGPEAEPRFGREPGGEVSEPRGPVRRGGVRGIPQATPAAKAPGEGTVRSLEAEFPDTVRLGAVEWLLVSITNEAATGHGLGLDVATGETLDILVQPRRGFVLEGEDRGTLTVPESGESLPLQFKLKAVDEGPGAIRVFAFRRGEPLGVISLTPVVEPASTPHVRGRSLPAARPRRSQSLAAPSSVVPDLSMLIQEREAGGRREYVILLTASDPGLELNYKTYGPFSLELDPAHFFEEFFLEIEGLPLDTDEQRALAERKLASKGSYLAEQLFTPELRQKLWEVRDRIASIVVQSMEPWIPWELCKLSGPDETGRIVDGKFLCEAYTITRWLPEQPFRRTLHLSNLAVIVPEDSGLPLAGAERDFVLSLADRKRRVTAIPPTVPDVQDAFAEGTYDGWHFTGHGAARDENPDRSSIYLGGEQPFTPEDMSGRAANVGLTHPIVFINACQVGRGGMALTGIGGWANRFIEAGAGAFIGAYWSVYDEPACSFAREVYGNLIAGKPVGEAIREARAAIRTPGDPTWLAYTVFADPLAAIAD